MQRDWRKSLVLALVPLALLAGFDLKPWADGEPIDIHSVCRGTGGYDRLALFDRDLALSFAASASDWVQAADRLFRGLGRNRDWRSFRIGVANGSLGG
jgi:hypothetical protein